MRAAGVLLGLCLAVAACGGSPEEPRSDGVVQYRFDGDGITGRLVLEGTEGVLVLTNESAELVGLPGVYSLDAQTGARTDARIAPVARVPVGETVRWFVRFGDEFDLGASGFIGLELGGEDAGGFSQQ